jgi:hypothetical protein
MFMNQSNTSAYSRLALHQFIWLHDLRSMPVNHPHTIAGKRAARKNINRLVKEVRDA